MVHVCKDVQTEHHFLPYMRIPVWTAFTDRLMWTVTPGWGIKEVVYLIDETCGYQTKRMDDTRIRNVDQNKIILLQSTPTHAIIAHSIYVYDSNFDMAQFRSNEIYDKLFDTSSTCWEIVRNPVQSETLFTQQV